MMNAKCGWIRIMVLLPLLLGLAFAVGCDDSDTGSVITITASTGGESVEGPATVAGNGTVLFTAQYRGNFLATATNQVDELMLPLEWSVNNPELGRIAGDGGHQAVYVSYGRVGQNIIFVKDQRGREGVTSVNQVSVPRE